MNGLSAKMPRHESVLDGLGRLGDTIATLNTVVDRYVGSVPTPQTKSIDAPMSARVNTVMGVIDETNVALNAMTNRLNSIVQRLEENL